MKWWRYTLGLLSVLALACGRNREAAEPAPAAGGAASGGESGGEPAGAGGANTAGAGATATVTGPAEVVYERGPQRPLPIEADETHLYWGESGAAWRILKAPKSGTGPVEEVGSWSGTEVRQQAIVVDATAIFWLDDTVIRKVDKDSGAASSPIRASLCGPKLHQLRRPFVAPQTPPSPRRVQAENGADPHHVFGAIQPNAAVLIVPLVPVSYANLGEIGGVAWSSDDQKVVFDSTGVARLKHEIVR